MNKLKKSIITTVIKRILEVALVLIFLIGLLSVIGFIASMIAPENEITNQFNMGQLYTLDFPEFEKGLEITSTDPAIFNESVELYGVVFFKTANRWFLLFFWMFYLVCWFLTLMIVVHLLRFLETLKDGSPFIRENVLRMKYIGWSVIAFTILRIIMLAGALYYMHSEVHVNGGSLALPAGEVAEGLHLELTLAGFIILIIAQIFDEGVKIKQEQELTV